MPLRQRTMNPKPSDPHKPMYNWWTPTPPWHYLPSKCEWVEHVGTLNIFFILNGRRMVAEPHKHALWISALDLGGIKIRLNGQQETCAGMFESYPPERIRVLIFNDSLPILNRYLTKAAWLTLLPKERPCT